MRPADWFGLCDTEREGYGCRPSIKLSGELVAPGWRNWQTQRTQNPPRATSWGFDPPSRHHLKYQYPLLSHRLAALVSALCFGCFWVDAALRYEFRYSGHPLSFQYLGPAFGGLYFC